MKDLFTTAPRRSRPGPLSVYLRQLTGPLDRTSPGNRPTTGSSQRPQFRTGPGPRPVGPQASGEVSQTGWHGGNPSRQGSSASSPRKIMAVAPTLQGANTSEALSGPVLLGGRKVSTSRRRGRSPIGGVSSPARHLRSGLTGGRVLFETMEPCQRTGREQAGKRQHHMERQTLPRGRSGGPGPTEWTCPVGAPLTRWT